MSSVKSRDNPMERRVRSSLHRRGLRFRTHVRALPGRPDIVLSRFQVAIFVDGDFWHGFNFPRWRDKLSPSWREKIAMNRRRDAKNFRRLRRSDWTVVRLWEHQLESDFERCIERVVDVVARRGWSAQRRVGPT
jgi:DNA mismatch endonuclease (patch repair protein)